MQSLPSVLNLKSLATWSWDGRAKSQRLDWACVQYRAVEESRRPWRFRLEHCSTQLKRERAERERERERERELVGLLLLGQPRQRRVGSSSTNTLVTGTGSALLQTAVKRSKRASEQVVRPSLGRSVQLTPESRPVSFVSGFECGRRRRSKEGDKKVGDL